MMASGTIPPRLTANQEGQAIAWPSSNLILSKRGDGDPLAKLGKEMGILSTFKTVSG